MSELKPFSWARMIEAVRNRALLATAALAHAEIPYAVVGGNAVAAWVARADRAAVRNTQDVDILLQRSDLPRAKIALEQAGFVYCTVYGLIAFWTDPTSAPGMGCIFCLPVKR